MLLTSEDDGDGLKHAGCDGTPFVGLEGEGGALGGDDGDALGDGGLVYYFDCQS